MNYRVYSKFKLLQILGISNRLDFLAEGHKYFVTPKKSNCSTDLIVILPNVFSTVGPIQVTHAEFSHLTMLAEIFGSIDTVFDASKPSSHYKAKVEESQAKLDEEENYESYREEVLRRDAREKDSWPSDRQGRRSETQRRKRSRMSKEF